MTEENRAKVRWLSRYQRLGQRVDERFEELAAWRSRDVYKRQALMKAMLDELKERGYRRASLAVQKANGALNMYKKLGFEIVDEKDEEYIMLCHLC